MTCGIDFVKITFKEGYSGFDNFLNQNNSKISLASDIGAYNKEISFNFNGIGFNAILSIGNKTISIRVGALREYKYDSRSKRRWQFLQTLYQYYPQLKITELHFATDVPYWFSKLKILPKRYTKLYEKSSVYFDIRRDKLPVNEKLKTKDDTIIYDKSWKCGLLLPMTRIELRLRREQFTKIINEGSIITEAPLQEKLSALIGKKLAPLQLKKSRGTVRLDECDRNKSIAIAMQFIQGDDSLLPLLLEDRTDEITESSRLFHIFIVQYCKLVKPRQNLMTHKQIKWIADNLEGKKKIQFQEMLKNFKHYNKGKWCKTSTNKTKSLRLTGEDKERVVEMSFQGMTMSDIGEELGVSEATISRVLKKYGIRRVRMRVSGFMLF